MIPSIVEYRYAPFHDPIQKITGDSYDYYTKFYQSTSRNKDRTPKSKMRNDLQRFCKYLREHPGAKKEDIMRDLNIRNLNRFQYITRYLRRDDKIEVDKGYKYYLKEH